MNTQSLVHLFFLGKTYEKVKVFRNSKHKNTLRAKRFIKNMSEGMIFFLDFLRNPINYCVNKKCTIYFCEQDTDFIYQIVHKIDFKRYIEIIININKDILEYLVIYYKTIKEGKQNMKIIQLENMKNIFMKEKNFFDNKLHDIQESIDNYQNSLDDVIKNLP